MALCAVRRAGRQRRAVSLTGPFRSMAQASLAYAAQTAQRMPAPSASAAARRAAVWALHAHDVQPDHSLLAAKVVVVGVVLNTSLGSATALDAQDEAASAGASLAILQQALARSAVAAVELALQRMAMSGAYVGPLVYVPDLADADAASVRQNHAASFPAAPVTHVVAADALATGSPGAAVDVAAQRTLAR